MLVQIISLVILGTLCSDALQAFDTENFEEVGRHFENFINKHGRTYEGEEKLMRFKVFADNLKVINRLNRNSGATYGITKFADVTLEERNRDAEYRTNLMDESDELGACTTLQGPETSDAPAAFDWRQKNAVSPARDMGVNWNSWAFSAVGVIESQLLMQGKQYVELSVQQLIDCRSGSHACQGDFPTCALTSILSNGGIESEADYPYTGERHTCTFNQTESVSSIKGCHTHNVTYEEQLQELLFKEGPLSIRISATLGWFYYKRGVLDDCEGYIMNHAVLLVGYGSENGKDYWLIKNSMGDDYGENGFIKILRGVGCSGIVSMSSLANIVTVQL